MLADMIGDKDLDIQRDSGSAAWLEDLILQAAQSLGYQSYFFAETLNGLEDDHVPFARVGIPVADIIDINYGYNNAYHHTTEDTLDKLSPKSLQIAGDGATLVVTPGNDAQPGKSRAVPSGQLAGRLAGRSIYAKGALGGDTCTISLVGP